MVNVISVDVEEYYHAANLSSVAGPGMRAGLPTRVAPSTYEVLELFDKYSVKATFFVLGYCARREPQLVRDIVSAGHELASHGYAHKIAYEQSESQFLRDVSIAKKLLEDISGVEVKGYRAPNFSITPKNPWGYRALAQAGYVYDSSAYPVWHPRYANTAESLEPTCLSIDGKKLLRFPLAVASGSLLGRDYRLPVAGGAYWRLLPRLYNKWGMRKINRSGRWFVTYFHPWEIDGDQPVFSELPFRKRIRHYGNVSSFKDRIGYFLENFEFSSFEDVALGYLDGSKQCGQIDWEINAGS